MAMKPLVVQQLQSPIDQLALELPALRARRLVRLQIGAIVLISMTAGLLGGLSAALPDEARRVPLLVLAIVMVLGGLFVGLTDYLHGASVTALVRTASGLRQSAAERAADLARANAALRRRDDDRATLFTTMSHELRTPLSSVVGYSQALLDDPAGQLTPEQRDDIAQIQQSGSSLLEIVNGTLDLARIDAGALTLTREPVPVRAVVEAVAALLRPLAATRGLDIVRAIPDDLSPVLADEDALRRVLVNLVSNAIKFTFAGTVTVRAEARDDQVIVVVSDTGIGIGSDAQVRIVEPFREADRGIARVAGGTGLGFAISKRLMELMGGRIWVESEPGAGSTFSLTLPAALPRPIFLNAGGEAAHCDVAVVGQPERAGQLLAALTRRGMVGRCFTGADWLGEVTAARPRLVLCDVLQPHAEGWRALARLHMASGEAAPVVGLVGLGFGTGRIALPERLEVMVESDPRVGPAVRELMGRHEVGPRSQQAPSRVLVVGSDVAWRRTTCSTLERAGVKIAEASNAIQAESLMRQSDVRGMVVDVRSAEPGIAELLGVAQADDARPGIPVLVLLPSTLTPRQQRELHLVSAAWSRDGALTLDKLAESIERRVADHTPRMVAAGGQAWRGH